MNINDLLADTQTMFVSDPEMGASESILFTHLNSGVEDNTFAFAGSIKNNSIEKDTIGTKMQFANVILSNEPKKDDTILYNGKLYSVDEDGWTYQNGMYLIKASIIRHRGRR